MLACEFLVQRKQLGTAGKMAVKANLQMLARLLALTLKNFLARGRLRSVLGRLKMIRLILFVEVHAYLVWQRVSGLIETPELV